MLRDWHSDRGANLTGVHAAFGSIVDDWRGVLGPAVLPDTLASIGAFVAAARRSGAVFPSPERVFAALEATPYATVRAVILGQDPYPTSGQAYGLAFSAGRIWRRHRRLSSAPRTLTSWRS